jgi:Mrp family chromosome partitioning ATPase
VTSPVAKPWATPPAPPAPLPAPKVEAPQAQPPAPPAPKPEPPKTEVVAELAPAPQAPKAETAAKPEAPPPKPAPSFHAAWEVDRFHWPEECDRLARGDAFASLAKTVAETARRGKKVIAITGIGRGEGRTTLALCLARRVAKEGVSVAVLDADFERPHLGRRIGIDMENGWDDVLTDDQPLTEAAVASVEDNLTVLPLGRRAAAFVSAHTLSALQQTSAAFDVVLVDMGPVSEEDHSDHSGEASAAAALMVCDCRNTTAEQLRAATERLQAAGIEPLGVVETFA